MQALERHRQREDREDARRPGDVALVERPTAEQDPDGRLADEPQTDGGPGRQDHDQGKVRGEHPAKGAPIARGGRSGQDREGGDREGRPDQADRDALEVAREADRADGAGGERRGEGGEVEERQRLDRLAEHLRHHQPKELADALRPHREARLGPEPGAPDPDHPDGEMRQCPEDRPDRGCVDPDLAGEQDGSDDDPAVVEQGSQPVGEEAAFGDEDLAEHERRREDERGEAHHPEQPDVERLLLRVEAGCDHGQRLRGEDEQDPRHDPHHDDCEGQDRGAEATRRLGGLATQRDEDRHERGDEAAGDDHVEGELGQDERGVVGIELGSGAERAREDPIAHEPHQVPTEGEHGQHDRPARQRREEERRGPPRDVRSIHPGVVSPATGGFAGHSLRRLVDLVGVA